MDMIWDVWAAIYLVPSDTTVPEIYLLKNLKNASWWVPCMTKLEFLLEPNMISRLGKLPLIYATCFALSLVKLCWPLWEVYHSVKNQDHVHATHICTTPTLGVGVKTCLPSRSIKNVLLLHWEWTQNMLVRFSIHRIIAPSFCCYLSKFCCRKET